MVVFALSLSYPGVDGLRAKKRSHFRIANFGNEKSPDPATLLYMQSRLHQEERLVNVFELQEM
ncbi:MAG TPA: hypothetical protein VGJ00_06685 [Rhabdochlamydiaceae bacterium]|jgi:hypothetical protein